MYEPLNLNSKAVKIGGNIMNFVNGETLANIIIINSINDKIRRAKLSGQGVEAAEQELKDFLDNMDKKNRERNIENRVEQTDTSVTSYSIDPKNLDNGVEISLNIKAQ